MKYKIGTKIYRLDKLNSLEEVVPLFGFDFSEGELQRRWSKKSCEIQEINVPIGKKARYIHLGFVVETFKQIQHDDHGELLPRDKRINSVISEALFFERDGKVFCVIMKRDSTSLNKIWKYLLKQSIWGEKVDTPKEYLLRVDMFYWLFYRFVTNSNILISKPLLKIRDVLGIDSATIKKQKTKSRGYEIHNLIGTKASLFTKDNIGTLGLCLQYEKEKIDLLLGATGECDIYINTYRGDYCHVENESMLRALLCYFVYNHIIVKTVESYENEINSNKWNDMLRDSFSDQLGVDIVKGIIKQLGIDKNNLKTLI